MFAHGFEGSPSGSKPTYMREALGWDVTAPVMSELGWSIASQTEVLLRHLDEGSFDLVVGSSMGGLAAANASSMRPEAEVRLLLIAPAFGLAENWEGMEEAGRSAWKTTGERRYTGFELDIVLPWEFMESAEKMSWPVPAHPTAIMHGKLDEVVPISLSRKVTSECANVSLLETEDSHRMKDSMRFISEVVSNLMEGAEISDIGAGEITKSEFSKVNEKLEDVYGIQEDLNEIIEDGGILENQDHETGPSGDIEKLEAEMRKLEEEMERKKAAIETSKKELEMERLVLEEEEHQEEKERLTIEASDAVIKAEEAVEIAKIEVDKANKRVEKEVEEAEEARLIAEMEEDEAREAKAEAEVAKRKLDEAVRKAKSAGKNNEKFTEEIEREKREDQIIERVGQRKDSVDWSRIGVWDGKSKDELVMINGIDEFTQRKLNSLGIFTYEQLANLDSEASQGVNDALELLPNKVTELAWTQQAITMLELKDVDKTARIVEDVDDSVIADLSASQINWAQIGEAGDRKSDDLSLIKGVDHETQKKLKVLGIRTFDQLSRIDRGTAEAVNGALGMMPGRVSKMMWADQAKSLMQE